MAKFVTHTRLIAGALTLALMIAMSAPSSLSSQTRSIRKRAR